MILSSTTFVVCCQRSHCYESFWQSFIQIRAEFDVSFRLDSYYSLGLNCFETFAMSSIYALLLTVVTRGKVDDESLIELTQSNCLLRFLRLQCDHVAGSPWVRHHIPHNMWDTQTRNSNVTHEGDYLVVSSQGTSTPKIKVYNILSSRSMCSDN